MSTLSSQALDRAQLDQLAINTIRTLALDAVQQADSGHAGLPLGAAPMAYVLWTRFLRHNPSNPKWINRDRFLLSAGHGSMLLYALLHLTGYPVSLDDLKHFRQLGSKTPGHPENHITPGVEITTGPLGQGFANGVGMAIGGAHLGARFNTADRAPIDHFIYGIVSDGDLMEGVACEAASLAGHLKLGRLIYLYDDNHITIEGGTDLTFNEDVLKRFEAYGWHTDRVADGNDLEAIERALRGAQAVADRPSLIAVRTVIGFGMVTQGTRKAHSDAPGEAAIKQAKQNLGWPDDAPPFTVPEPVRTHMRAAVERGAALESEWNAGLAAWKAALPDRAKLWDVLMSESLPAGWETSLPSFEGSKAMATRAASGEVINAIAGALPMLIGGSADLAPSNNTEIKDGGSFQPGSYEGRNLHYGIREHAMGAAMNGIALNGGLIPFGGTFMCFSDYMKPAVRLAALSEIQTVFVFTHDSVGLGEDGPTHQPIEQLAGLRAIPNLAVIRPADAHETREAWRIAIERRKAPTALVLSRQKVAVIDRARHADASGTARGGYVLADAQRDGQPTAPALILIATGSEVGLALEARELLQASGTPTRVVSMPCTELFDMQDRSYRESVLPSAQRMRMSIEAGATWGWERYVGLEGVTYGLDQFGASGKGEQVLAHFGFTAQAVAERARKLLAGEG